MTNQENHNDTVKSSDAESVTVEALVMPHTSFDQWKQAAFEYLHKICREELEFTSEQINNLDWMLGDDEEMLPSYNEVLKHPKNMLTINLSVRHNGGAMLRNAKLLKW